VSYSFTSIQGITSPLVGNKDNKKETPTLGGEPFPPPSGG
jgi:hypothetical protein